MRGILLFTALLALMPLFAQDREDWVPFYRDGELMEEQVSDSLSRPVALRIYHKGVLQETRTYEYGEDRITLRVAAGEGKRGEKSWQDILYLREDGSLRMMERTEGVLHILAGQSPRSEWIRTGNRQEIYLYGSSGEIRERSLYEGDLLKEEESYAYDDEARLLSSEILWPVKQEREITLYSEMALPTEVRLYRKELLASQTNNGYDDRGLLVSEEIRGGGVHSERILSRDETGGITTEQLYRDNFLVRKIVYEGDERTEEIFSRGKLTLTVRYRGSEIIDETKSE
jgi:hypothetical protein